MDNREFLNLKIGTVILNRFDKSKYFVIYDNDQMGSKYKGKEYAVYGAKEINSDKPDYIRIDKNNAKFWLIKGKILKE